MPYYGQNYRKNGMFKAPQLTSVVSGDLLLDTVTNASLAYSLRLINTSYSGNAVKVRRSLDNSEQDIGFSSGSLNTASLLSFVGTYSGYVTTWYDQSGNTKNASQTTSGYQPRIVNAGTYDGAVVFDGSDDILDAGDNFTNKTAVSCFVNANNTTLNTSRMYDKTNKLFFVNSSGQMLVGQNYTGGDGLWRSDAVVSVNVAYKFLYTYTGVVTESPIMYLDGASTTVTNVSVPSGTYKSDTGNSFTIGNRIAGDRQFTGKMTEFVIYDRVLNASEISSINTL
jgi:hypothetical protein